MTVRSLFALLALSAASAAVASATPITYSMGITFNAPSPVAQTVTGTVTMDGSTLLNWSFDFSPLDSVIVPGEGSIRPIDANGSYVMNLTNSVATNTPGTYDFNIYAYSGDGASANSYNNDYTVLNVYFNALPGNAVLGPGNEYASFSESGNGVYAIFATNTFAATQVAQTTPEPPSGLLFATGLVLAGAGLFWFERRRAAALA